MFVIINTIVAKKRVTNQVIYLNHMGNEVRQIRFYIWAHEMISLQERSPEVKSSTQHL